MTSPSTYSPTTSPPQQGAGAGSQHGAGAGSQHGAGAGSQHGSGAGSQQLGAGSQQLCFAFKRAKRPPWQLFFSNGPWQ